MSILPLLKWWKSEIGISRDNGVFCVGRCRCHLSRSSSGACMSLYCLIMSESDRQGRACSNTLLNEIALMEESWVKYSSRIFV